MKSFFGLLVVSLILTGGWALPARIPDPSSNDAELIDVARTTLDDVNGEEKSDDPNYKNFKGIVDTGVGYPFLQPNPPVFSFNTGFFDVFDDLLQRLRARLWASEESGGIFRELSPELTSEIENEDNYEAHGNADGFLVKPINKANSSSIVKVINGNKVVINQTLYKDDNGFVKIRVINIRPLESGEVVDNANASASKDVGVDNINSNAVVTTAPIHKINNNDSNEAENASNERREPLEKATVDNEVLTRNIDDPEVKH